MPNVIARRLLVSGRVQGVGFRDWLVAEARRLGLSGWVRNIGDGMVEALVAGEEPAVLACLRACRRGPPAAEVDHISDREAEPPTAPGFRRRPSLS